VRYQPVLGTDVFILRAEAGVTLADSREGIPQDFLFRTGGGQSVRGYDYQSLGVRQGSATVGGRYLGTVSAEYVRWFQPQWGAAVFVDAGDAADNREDFDLRLGYGLGARWRSPAGPLAIDLAWGHHERQLRLHFGVAIAF
jgi:translocation and assembly module TamA